MVENSGDVLNQLALISDLVEKLNLNSISKTLTFMLDKNEFLSMFFLVENKYGKKMPAPTNTFEMKIGEVKIIFNKNNV